MRPRWGANPIWRPPGPLYCYHNALGNLQFAWDRRKAQSNIGKNGVSFEEARSVFLDESARLISDPDRSAEEERFVLLGYSFQARCLIVSPLLPRARFSNPLDLGYFR